MAYGTTPTGSDTLPLGSVYVPNTAGSNLTPLQGGTPSTDTNGNVSAPVAAQIVNAGVFGDTFSSSTNITAATTFSGVPTVSQLVTNSYVTLANPGGQATFVAELTVASAFIGTLSFYALAPDASTLQLINAHQRGTTTTANNSAISTASALTQVWMGSAVTVKSVYVVCTAYTSGTASATLGLSAAPYAQAILNTVTVTGSISASNPSVGTDGSAIPTSSTLLGASDGTNLQQLLVESSSNHNLRVGVYSGANEATVTGANALKVDGSAVTQPVQQADLTATGTLSAAQPTQDTPVSNATVALTLGKGNTSFAVDLRGTFSSGSVVSFDGTINGTNWFSINATPIGSTGDTEVSSVSGGAAVQYQGNASGLQQVRVRCSTYTASDAITVTLIGSVSSDGGFLSKALPAGSNTIGGVQVVDSAGTNKLTVTGTGAAKVDGSAVTQPVSGTVGAVEYAWNGGAVNNQNYDRLRQVQALSAQTASISSGGGVGSLAPVLASATGLQPGQWVLFTGGTAEWVLTANTYTAGSTTLALTSAIVNAGHTTASWNAYSVYGPGAAQFYWESIGVNALALNYNNQGVLAQADSSGNLKVNVATGSVTATTNADTTIGSTTAPAKELLIAGKTNDGTPQYQPLPEGAGGRSVIIEGYTGGTAVPVSGTFWQTTQPVSAASLPLPTGAATSAKQPALGTAGTASTDVLSVQGIASMTPLKVDGSAVTQPVSGTITANAGTNLNTSALALESGGNLATLAGAVTSAKVQSNVAQINGVAPTLDNTSIQAVSMRGKNSVAGDTALLVDASGRVYVNVNSLPSLAAGTAVVGSVLLQAVSGTALLADQSNSELRVSLYGKNSAAGDTAILTDSTGRQLIGRSTVSVYALASGAQTASGNSGDLTVGNYTEISLDISVTAQSGTTPTLQFFYDRKGSDGVYYPLWQSSQLTSSTTLTATISTSIGAGMAYNQSLGLTGRLRWTIGGTTPSWTFSASIYGK